MRVAKLMRLGDRAAAWISPGNDGYLGSGDEELIVARDIGGPGFNVQAVDLGAARGLDGFTVPMEEGRFGFRYLGADGRLGSSDDGVGAVWLDAQGQVQVEAISTGDPIHLPYGNETWPKHLGNGRLAFRRHRPTGV